MLLFLTGNSLSTDHHPGQQLPPMPARGPRDMGMPNTAPSQPPSEAQSRGIYGSCGSPTSNVTHLGRYELKRPPNEEAGDRSVKRRPDAEEVEEVEDEEDDEEEEEEEEDDDEPIAPSDNVKMRRGFMCKNRPLTCNAHKLTETSLFPCGNGDSGEDCHSQQRRVRAPTDIAATNVCVERRGSCD